MKGGFLALWTAILCGCAVGPAYVRPPSPTLSAYAEFDAHVYSTAPPIDPFWRTLDDVTLAQLIENALILNTDLRAAVARLDRAGALAGLSRFEQAPTVTASGAYARTRESAVQAPGFSRAQRDLNIYQDAAVFSWELDFFGRVRRSVGAARADRDATLADLYALRVSLAAEVARTYFQLRGAQEQLDVARSNAENQRATLQLTEARLQAGRGTDFDTARARVQLESTLARIPLLEDVIAVAAHRLAVLAGKPPGELLQLLEPSAPLPKLPHTVAVGEPADLLRRRPDIAAAERRLAASTQRIGVATAALFPRVTLLGSVGAVATDGHDLFSRDAQSYSFGPAIDWSFLDVGRVRARIEASRADAAADLALYEGTVLRAYEEAENALHGYTRAQAALDNLERAAAAGGDAARLAHQRFEGGASDFLQVLEAERARLDAEDALAQAHLRAATALVAVYRALAGGAANQVPAPAAPSPRT